MTNISSMPTLFIEHGSPFALDDLAWQADLFQVANQLPKPTAILLVSAHWQTPGISLGATQTVPLLYDFYGFPDHMYRVQYAAPGAPELAERVESLLSAAETNFGSVQKTTRGLDHGAFIPLMAMYPKADIPVLQMAIPGNDPKFMHAVGQALAPLREEGVLILGTGYLIHNLRLVQFGNVSQNPPSWVREFDAWVENAITRRDTQALLNFATQAPHLPLALPTDEHFVPLFIPMGAADAKDSVSFPLTGFLLGTFTRRSILWSA